MSDLLHLIQAALGEVLKGHMPSPEVVKPLISKGLGYSILAGSTLVKVPQLAAVVRAGSAEGLNPLAMELEDLGLALGTAYGFILGLPFSSFGEVVALFVQNTILLLLVYGYQRRGLARPITVLALLASFGFAALAGMIGPEQITRVYDMNNVILIASRLRQIAYSARAGSTGQLSLITYGLNAAGASARIFTSIHDKAGAAMIRSAIISTVLNFIIAAQIVFMGPKGTAAKKKAAAERKAKKIE